MNAAALALVATIPNGGTHVLTNVAQGRSPWHGWENGTVANSGEGADAYGVRARIITKCRERGLLTPENLLTEAGRAAVAAMEARLG